MVEQRWSPECPDDDSTFLAGLLITAESEIRSPACQLRPASLRSKEQLRREALDGYRFRNWFDYLLVRVERILLIAIVAFFGWWLADGYGRDLLHRLQKPQSASLDLQAIAQGASAAEVSGLLGDSLPFETSAMEAEHDLPGVLPARQPDYLIPSHGFLLPPPPLRTPTPTSTPVDPRPVHLIVPKMNLDTPVQEVFLENGIWQVAEYAAGYHHGTAFPGQGNTVLAGHAGLRGGVFARLGDLAPGDDVYLDAGTTRYHYRVRASQNVWPHQVEVMYPTKEAIVTMITCTAWDTQRLVVVADLVDTAPLSPAEGENAGKGDSSP